MCNIIPKSEPAIAVSESNQLVLPGSTKNCTTSKIIETIQTIKNAHTRDLFISIFMPGFFRVITSELPSSKRLSISTSPMSRVIIRATAGGIAQCERYFTQRSGLPIENPNKKKLIQVK